MSELWTRSAEAIWLPNLVLVVAVILLSLRATIRRLPPQLEDTAILDGCGFWRTLRHIILPRLGPAFLAALLVALVVGWEDLMGPQIGSHPVSFTPFSFSSSTIPGPPPGRTIFSNTFHINCGEVVALLMLILVPVVAFLYLSQRFLLKGRFTTPPS
jgi:ABC-type glycerol-3-phosphate transport system permease component